MFSRTEASRSYTSDYLHEFTSVMNRQNICKQAFSCSVLTKSTSPILRLLTFKHPFQSPWILGLFVCPWADRSHIVSRAPQPPHVLPPCTVLGCDSLCVCRSSTPLAFRRSRCYSRTPQPSRQHLTTRLFGACILCGTGRQESKRHKNEFCSSAAEGGVWMGRFSRAGAKCLYCCKSL